MGSLSRLGFHAREERVISGLARWMGLLGRFQIVASTFIFVLFLAAAALVTAAEVIEPSGAAQAEQPLVSIGEVSRTTIGIVVAVVVGFSLLFFRGGMLLVSAAEDLETASSQPKGEEDARDLLESAVRRLRSYFVLETLLMTAAAVAVYAGTIMQWPGL